MTKQEEIALTCKEISAELETATAKIENVLKSLVYAENKEVFDVLGVYDAAVAVRKHIQNVKVNNTIDKF